MRAVVDGTADSQPGDPSNGGQNINRNEALPYLYRVTGITAGSKVVKLQCEQQGVTNHVDSGRFTVWAFAE